MTDDFDKELQETIKRAQKIGNGSRVADQSPNLEKKSDTPEVASSGIEETINAARTFNRSVNTLKRWNEQIRAFYLKIEPAFIVIWKIAAWCSLGIIPILKCVLKKYARFVKSSVWRENPETGEFSVSKKGAISASTVTILFAAFLYFGAVPMLLFGFQIIQQGIMETFSSRTGYVYTTDADVIVKDHVYSVSASRTLPASEDSTQHFHIERDVWHWLWYPEDIYDAIPEEISFAIIHYNGIRVKILGWYPEIKRILAFPLNSLPQDHPAHTGKRIDEKDIRNYILKRLPKDHPVHEGAEITRDDLRQYMMLPPVL